MAYNAVAALQMVQDNLVRLLIVVTQAVSNPGQSAIDAVTAAYNTAAQNGTAAGFVVPKPDYSVDGESYQWSAYRVAIEKSILDVQKLIVVLGGNFIVRSRGQV